MTTLQGVIKLTLKVYRCRNTECSRFHQPTRPEVVREALQLADRYHGAGVRPWLLRIGQNLIKQKRERQASHRQKEMLLCDVRQQARSTLRDDEFFDLFTTQISQERAQLAELREDLKNALADLSEEDQNILNLYVRYGYNHSQIARILQIKPGAARTRYCRAVSRLRDVWMARNENRREESDA